jgi:hypothetical protein
VIDESFTFVRYSCGQECRGEVRDQIHVEARLSANVFRRAYCGLGFKVSITPEIHTGVRFVAGYTYSPLLSRF